MSPAPASLGLDQVYINCTGKGIPAIPALLQTLTTTDTFLPSDPSSFLHQESVSMAAPCRLAALAVLLRRLPFRFLVAAAIASLLLLLLRSSSSSALELGYYRSSCPDAERVAKQTLEALLLADVTASAALLRLAFHDCQVNGCDASILLRDHHPEPHDGEDRSGHGSGSGSVSELSSAKNFGIRRLDFIDRIKAELELRCPGVVSCADIVVLAARDSIASLGGPNIPVLTGRMDSRAAFKDEADVAIPGATSSVDDALKSFEPYELTVDETVALLGSHTLGVSHCVSFQERLSGGGGGGGDGDGGGAMDPILRDVLREVCGVAGSSKNRTRSVRSYGRRWFGPYRKRVSGSGSARGRAGGDGEDNGKDNGGSTTLSRNRSELVFALNDATPSVFDNVYFREVRARRGLLAVDAGLRADARTSAALARFAADRRAFFDAYATAFLKLTTTTPTQQLQQLQAPSPSPSPSRSSPASEVRRRCWSVNDMKP